MTRNRATADHVLTVLRAEYYAQRASSPGTLLITEATLTPEKALGQQNAPGTRNQADFGNSGGKRDQGWLRWRRGTRRKRVLIGPVLDMNSNERTHESSIENRIRLTDEVMDPVVAAVDVERARIRLSPWKMGTLNPAQTHETLVKKSHSKHPDLAYIHVIEPDKYGLMITALKVERNNAFADTVWVP
ncbi:hypothetical protein K488DRAFT_86170 [Vararia minispora EC-137]|uniref:Uncharacterized protein n=1 Tax=Vararia minispora EC-137 TaxID=1314806 RepID=A0ACB8QKE0_9AGAM|nr:hypothetical protein K488DRAFT_86170 [Vararia minispora EC-137]